MKAKGHRSSRQLRDLLVPGPPTRAVQSRRTKPAAQTQLTYDRSRSLGGGGSA